MEVNSPGYGVVKDINQLLQQREQLDPSFCQEYLAAAKAFFLDQLKQRAWVSHLVQVYSQLVDGLLLRLFHQAREEFNLKFYPSRQPVALLALGGYGRKELNLHSDLDLTFLFQWKMTPFVEALSERIFYFLWDAGFDVSFTTRTIEDCVKLAKENLASRTALIDARFLAGDEALYADFCQRVFVETIYKNARTLLEEKAEVAARRHEKYGGSIYLLEPNIKQGKGGLRDIHTALWVLKIKFKCLSFGAALKKGLITKRDVRTLAASYEFLLRVRNHLHGLSGRKNDLLTFDYQEEVAKLMGYQGSGRLLPVEQLMRSYYRHANNVTQFMDKVIELARGYPRTVSRGFSRLSARDIGDGFRIYQGELLPASLAIFKEDPVRLLRAFKYARDHQVGLGRSLRELIRDNLKLIDATFRCQPEVNRIFLELLTSGPRAYELLKAMHEVRLLGRLIPEFSRIECLVQYDVYHIYTVDTHSLFVVKELASYISGKDEAGPSSPYLVGPQIRRPELLLLAGLLHDLGKGKGSPHARKGAALVRKIGQRMGLRRPEINLLAFLVDNHLLLTTLAQRRDLTDQKLIIELANKVQEEQLLKMLYLLSVADIKSVGPEALTDWKSILLEELYLKTAETLERGDQRGELAKNRLEEIADQVVACLKEDLPLEEAYQEVRQMPARYLLSFTPQEMARHILMMRQLPGQVFLVEVTPGLKENYSRFTICTRDHLGLFAQITGVMAANHVNILAAQINTSTSGIALDVFLLNDAQGRAVTDEEKWKQIYSHLEAVLAGRTDVGELVARTRGPSSLLQKKGPRFPSQVLIDNRVSDHYTVIDVYAHDRLGLLYDIARTLTGLGLTIDFSKIATKVDQAVDAFYVRDKEGGKLLDQPRLRAIKRALLRVIG